MDKFLICLDLDGTLLTDEKQISPYTKQVLKTLQAQGHYIMIATGRPFRASKVYYEELGLDTPVVNFNGAYVHHPHDPNFKTVHEKLDLDISHSIIDTLNQTDISNIIAERKDCVFISRHDKNLFDGFSMGTKKIVVGNLLENLKRSPTSLLIEAPEHVIPIVKQVLCRFYAENIEHRRWGAPYPVIEIVKKGVSKATGIDTVKDYLDVPRERIIAFGDEDNDNEMIKFAEYGVAMENGIDELKFIANDVTHSNNDDGIGRYLNDFFKLNLPYQA